MTAKSSAERAFVEKAMALVRAELYPQVSDSVFEREWADLLLAISEPAKYLHERSLKLPGSRYLAIVGQVVREIRAHGAARRGSLPHYLRKCLQDHMQIRGEGYLDEAKGLVARSAGAVAGKLVAKLRIAAEDPEAGRLTDALVAARDLITASRRAKTRA